MDNHRLQLINLIKQEIIKLRTMGDMYPVGRNFKIYERTPTPQTFEDDANLPAMLFGYAPTNYNNRRYGTEYQGEHLRLAVIAYINETRNNDLVTEIANTQASLETIMYGLGVPDNFGDSGIDSTQFSLSAEPFTQGLSDIEIMRFTIQVGWYFNVNT